MKFSAGRTTTALGVLALLGLILSACTNSENGNSGSDVSAFSETDNADTVPAFVFLTSNVVDFNQVQIAGMEDVVEPLGGSITVLDAQGDVEQQNTNCQDAVTSGRYNGMIINAVSGPGAIPCVETAHSHGIPVVAMENVVGMDPEVVEPQVDGVILSATVSAKDSATADVDLLEQACGNFNPCDFLHTVGGLGVPHVTVLLDTLDERLASVPSMVRLSAPAEDGYNPEVGLQVARDLISANPEVDVIQLSSDSTAALVGQYVREELGRDDVLVVGSGGSRVGLAAIEEGVLYGTKLLVPRDFGRISAQALVDFRAGEDLMSASEVAEALSPRLVTAENVLQYEAQWG